ncbi:hypothetical protein ACFE04_016497 [Oxalis oulophora]
MMINREINKSWIFWNVEGNFDIYSDSENFEFQQSLGIYENDDTIAYVGPPLDSSLESIDHGFDVMVEFRSGRSEGAICSVGLKFAVNILKPSLNDHVGFELRVEASYKKSIHLGVQFQGL